MTTYVRKSVDVHYLYVDFGEGFNLVAAEFTARDIYERQDEWMRECPDLDTYVQTGKVPKVNFTSAQLTTILAAVEAAAAGKKDDPYRAAASQLAMTITQSTRPPSTVGETATPVATAVFQQEEHVITKVRQTSDLNPALLTELAHHGSVRVRDDHFIELLLRSRCDVTLLDIPEDCQLSRIETEIWTDSSHPGHAQESYAVLKLLFAKRSAEDGSTAGGEPTLSLVDQVLRLQDAVKQSRELLAAVLQKHATNRATTANALRTAITAVLSDLLDESLVGTSPGGN